MDFLVSRDLKTVGIFIRLDEQHKYDIPIIEGLLGQMRAVVKANIPETSEFRIIGPPSIILAIHRYNIQTAMIFWALCLTIGISVTVYIFKSMKVAALALLVIGLSVLWILAFMSVTGIPLTATTALSFGLVLIVSVAVVIRIVTHFNERYQVVRDRVEAARQGLGVVFFPCFVCSVTTAVGFGTTMVTSIPMVFQLGLVMFLGVLLSFVMAVILTPAFLIAMKPLEARSYQRMAGDWVALALAGMEKAIFGHYLIVTVLGVTLTLAMVAGVPFIRSDTQLLRMLSASTKEMKDLRFVESHLAALHTLELVIEADGGAFNKPQAWEKVSDLEKELRKLPEVISTDSFLPFLEYLDRLFHGSGERQGGVLSNPGLIRDLFALLSLSEEGRLMTGRYVDGCRSLLHVSVRIRNSPGVPIAETIETVRSTAASVMKEEGKVTVTGDIAVFASQASEIVRSQLLSLALAFTIITIILMIHLGSALLGLISLIPNIPPVAVIFGVMGWLGISLDTITVFAASVALGLAVDDTVHYLSVLKEQIRLKDPQKSVEDCVRKAYSVTAKAMVSTSAVLFFGFLVLIISPFKPVVSFGILGASAILAAVLADVIFLPSVILTSSGIRRFLGSRMSLRGS
jgi:predicted RND superfamily exporter protein